MPVFQTLDRRELSGDEHGWAARGGTIPTRLVQRSRNK